MLKKQLCERYLHIVPFFRLVPEAGDLQHDDSMDQSIESNVQTNSCTSFEDKMLGRGSEIDSSKTPSPNSRYLIQLNGDQTENRIEFIAENEEKEPVYKESTMDKENIKMDGNIYKRSTKEESQRNYFSDSDDEEYISGIFLDNKAFLIDKNNFSTLYCSTSVLLLSPNIG